MKTTALKILPRKQGSRGCGKKTRKQPMTVRKLMMIQKHKCLPSQKANEKISETRHTTTADTAYATTIYRTQRTENDREHASLSPVNATHSQVCENVERFNRDELKHATYRPFLSYELELHRKAFTYFLTYYVNVLSLRIFVE